MAYIEIMGNPIQQWEKNQDELEAEELGRPNFWQWELKLLKQEQQNFRDHLDKLQDKIDQETEDGNSSNDVENKYKKDKDFLLRGLKRALNEEVVHMKEADHRKYKVWDTKYKQSIDWEMDELTSNGRQAFNN